jgi:hypothetical protein
MSAGIEETLKEIIRLRVMGALQEIESEPTPKEMRTIMEVATESVYGPVLDVIKTLGEETGLVLVNANSALLLPDSLDNPIVTGES